MKPFTDQTHQPLHGHLMVPYTLAWVSHISVLCVKLLQTKYTFIIVIIIITIIFAFGCTSPKG